MITIYKYEVKVGFNLFKVPTYARMLSFGQQDGKFYVWALVDTGFTQTQRHRIEVVGTGWELEGQSGFHRAPFLGTLQDPDGFVWHAFDLGPQQ